MAKEKYVVALKNGFSEKPGRVHGKYRTIESARQEMASLAKQGNRGAGYAIFFGGKVVK